MRAPMSKGLVEEWRNVLSWGKGRTRSFRDSGERLVHPKVARWAEEEYQNMPYFIKVIASTSDYSRHKVNHGTIFQLPPAFTREHFLKLDKDVTLEDAVDGSTWKVSFRAPGFTLWSQGWPQFSMHNNLQRGNIIVFALVSHSRFLFTLFNDQGCQIIYPSRQETKRESEQKYEGNRGSHSVTCPKHYTRVQLKLEFQEDGANISHDMGHADNFPAQDIGHDTCQAALNKLQPKRISKAPANSAQDYHHICKHMGFPCEVHQHLTEEKPKIRPVEQILEKYEEDLPHQYDKDLLEQYEEDLLEECEKGLEQCEKKLEQMQIATCMDSEPLVEERALSEMTMSEANSQSDNTIGISDEPMKAHVDPHCFIFMSNRRVVTNKEKREAKNAASRYARTLRGPNSLTILREFHVYREFSLELPRTLVLFGGAVIFPQSALTLVDSTGRSWEMQWYASGRHRLALLPKDWSLFAVHHFLEEGDACVFETTDIGTMTILVRIFRVVDIHGNVGSDGIYTHYSVEFAS